MGSALANAGDGLGKNAMTAPGATHARIIRRHTMDSRSVGADATADRKLQVTSQSFLKKRVSHRPPCLVTTSDWK